MAFKVPTAEEREAARWKHNKFVSAKFDYIAQHLLGRAQEFPRHMVTLEGWRSHCGTTYDEILNRPGYGLTLAAGEVAKNVPKLLDDANDGAARFFVGKRARAWAGDDYLAGLLEACQQVQGVIAASNGQRPEELAPASKGMTDALRNVEAAGMYIQSGANEGKPKLQQIVEFMADMCDTGYAMLASGFNVIRLLHALISEAHIDKVRESVPRGPNATGVDQRSAIECVLEDVDISIARGQQRQAPRERPNATGVPEIPVTNRGQAVGQQVPQVPQGEEQPRVDVNAPSSSRQAVRQPRPVPRVVSHPAPRVRRSTPEAGGSASGGSRQVAPTRQPTPRRQASPSPQRSPSASPVQMRQRKIAGEAPITRSEVVDILRQALPGAVRFAMEEAQKEAKINAKKRKRAALQAADDAEQTVEKPSKKKKAAKQKKRAVPPVVEFQDDED